MENSAIRMVRGTRRMEAESATLEALETRRPRAPQLTLVVAGAAAAARGQRLQRALNVAVALLGIVLTLPLMVLIAVAIKLTSPGPVLYTQPRVGVDRRRGRSRGSVWRAEARRAVDFGGQLFTIYKFRTMSVEDGRSTDQVWASPSDPRVTAIGRFLRKYRLDELPQLFNVLRGDMNVVGPRPEQPKIFMRLRDQIENYAERQRVLPGITGWAQVNLHYDDSFDSVRKKLEYDLEYVRRQSVLEDLKIMLRTVPVVIFGRGAW